MRVNEIYREKKVTNGNYGNETVGVRVILDEGEDPETALEWANVVITNELASIPKVSTATKEHVSNPAKTQTQAPNKVTALLEGEELEAFKAKYADEIQAYKIKMSIPAGKVDPDPDTLAILSDDAVVQLMAREMGVTGQPTLKVEGLEEGQNNVILILKVSAVKSPTIFQKKDGSEGSRQWIGLFDDSGQTSVTLWGEQREQAKELKKDDTVRIEAWTVKKAYGGTGFELALGRSGSLTIIESAQTTLDSQF